jgi:hypothetical protein
MAVALLAGLMQEPAQGATHKAIPCGRSMNKYECAMVNTVTR